MGTELISWRSIDRLGAFLRGPPENDTPQRPCRPEFLPWGGSCLDESYANWLVLTFRIPLISYGAFSAKTGFMTLASMGWLDGATIELSGGSKGPVTATTKTTELGLGVSVSSKSRRPCQCYVLTTVAMWLLCWEIYRRLCKLCHHLRSDKPLSIVGKLSEGEAYRSQCNEDQDLK